MELENLFPKRSIRLVFHSSGVSRRVLEIQDFIPQTFRVLEIDDFKGTVKIAPNMKSSILRNSISRLLEHLGFIGKPINYQALSDIRPWTIQLRSHYSHIKFRDEILTKMFEGMLSFDSPSQLRGGSIHYRLGDLLSIDKSFVDPDLISSIVLEENPLRWNIYSDSIDKARILLNLKSDYNQIYYFGLEVKSYDVLEQILNSEIFIGTTSKISIWATILRVRFNIGKRTYLPRSLKLNLHSLLTNEQCKKIDFFGK